MYHYQLKAALNHLYHISLLPCNVLVFVRLLLGLTDLPEERNLLKRNMFLHSKEKNSRARERDKSETNRSKPFCLAKLPGAQRREENSTQRLSCCGDPLLPFSTTRRVARVSAVCSSPLPRFRNPAAPPRQPARFSTRHGHLTRRGCPPNPGCSAVRSSRPRRPPRRPPRLLSSPRSPARKKEGGHFVLVGSQPARSRPVVLARPPAAFLPLPPLSPRFPRFLRRLVFFPGNSLRGQSQPSFGGSSYRPGISSRRGLARRLSAPLRGRRGAEIHPDVDRSRLLVSSPRVLGWIPEPRH